MGPSLGSQSSMKTPRPLKASLVPHEETAGLKQASARWRVNIGI